MFSHNKTNEIYKISSRQTKIRGDNTYWNFFKSNMLRYHDGLIYLSKTFHADSVICLLCLAGGPGGLGPALPRPRFDPLDPLPLRPFPPGQGGGLWDRGRRGGGGGGFGRFFNM